MMEKARPAEIEIRRLASSANLLHSTYAECPGGNCCAKPVDAEMRYGAIESTDVALFIPLRVEESSVPCVQSPTVNRRSFDSRLLSCCNGKLPNHEPFCYC